MSYVLVSVSDESLLLVDELLLQWITVVVSDVFSSCFAPMISHFNGVAFFKSCFRMIECCGHYRSQATVPHICVVAMRTSSRVK